MIVYILGYERLRLEITGHAFFKKKKLKRPIVL